MPNTYLPASDAGLLNWSSNFAAKIVAAVDPASLGLTADDVASYLTLQQAYATAYTAATTPETRGGATVLAKNVARSALITGSQRLAMAVKNHPGVTDQQRYDMGLTVRDRQSTPVPPPATSPEIDIISVVGETVKLRLHDATTTGRGKPMGVLGATVFSFVGDAPPSNIKAWSFEGSTTKTTLDVVFDSSLQPGSKVWLTAFWYNRQAQRGPTCAPVSTYLQGGGLSLAA